MAYKVVDADQLDADLTTVADAIREKTGGTELLSFPDGMAAEIAKLGDGSNEEYVAEVEEINKQLSGTIGTVDVTLQENADRLDELNTELEQTLCGTDTGSTLETNIAQVNSDLQAIKSAIVDSGVEVADGTSTSEYADKVGEVYEAGEQAGKQAEYDAFWDVYQDYGSRTHYNAAFAGFGWNDEIFNPKYPLENVQYAANTFLQSNVTEVKRIGFTEMLTALISTFESARELRTLNIVLSETNTFAQTFRYCVALVHLSITGTIGGSGLSLSDSTLLSKDSILSVINALSDTTSDLTVTLSLTAVNNAFETSEGAADGSTSDEWLALVETKSNWTISLS